MIEVNISHSWQNYLMDLKGHARTETDGSPEICAAASALAYALAEWTIANVPAAQINYTEADGRMFLSAYGQNCAQAWAVMETGFRQLAYAHPEYVKII